MNIKLIIPAIVIGLSVSSATANAAPSVTGNVISWPADGWYEVQRADDYTSVCNGTASCTVEQGVYNVINHTSMQRFDGIRVASAANGSTVPTTNGDVGTVTVDGDTIRWPTDGWYQVQRANDFSTICNGTDFCKVSAGVYNIINHTTQRRFDGITVGSVTPAMPENPASPPLTDNDTLAAIQPKNLSISIYSGTAAELFWTPAGLFRPAITKNEIRRDGVLIDTVQGEFLRSYFDGTREPNTNYTYEITAISSAGRASASISDIDENPPETMAPPSSTTPTIDLPVAVRSKLDTSFEIINGVPVEKVMATLAKLADRDARASLGLVPTGTRTSFNDRSADVYSCPLGGELLDLQVNTLSRYSSELEANDCAIGSIVFSATATINGASAMNEMFRPTSVSARGIELVDARDVSTITSDTMFFFIDSTDLRFSRWSGFNVAVERPQNSYSVDTMTGNGRDQGNRLPDGSFGLTVSGKGIVGVFSSNATLNTQGPFEFANGRENAYPNAGRLLIGTTTDNLFINASNGDPETYALTVTNNGVTTSYNVPFSDIYRFEAPITGSIDIGF